MTAAPTTMSGRCLCGAVRYRVDGPVLWSAHCHCESCRRATSAAFATFLGVARNSVTWTAAEPAWFVSSPGVQRAFCARCGSPMAYQADARADEMDLYAATLDAPEKVAIDMEVHRGERLPWADPSTAPHRYDGSADG